MAAQAFAPQHTAAQTHKSCNATSKSADSAFLRRHNHTVNRCSRYLWACKPSARASYGAALVHSTKADAPWRTLGNMSVPTPLVRLQRLGQHMNGNVLLAKLEGFNVTGSSKDRSAMFMLQEAEKAGLLKPGDTLVEAASGNAARSLALAAAVQGYRLKLFLPADLATGRGVASMQAYGAEVQLIDGSMDEARERALAMQRAGQGHMLDMSCNPDSALAHLRTTGPEIWAQTQGRVSHLVSGMDSTATVMGTSAYLKSMNAAVQVIGVQPEAGVHIPGLSSWSSTDAPSIFQPWRVDGIVAVGQHQAELATRVLARTEGICSGISSGAVLSAALRLSAQVHEAIIVMLVSDQGDRFSTGIFSAQAGRSDPGACGPEEFWSAAQCLPGFPGPHWVLFTGQEPGTPEPWCDSAAPAAAAVRQAVREAGGTLLEVHVGSKAAWEDPQHVLRADRLLQLRMLPTLMLFHTDGCSPSRKASGDTDVLLGLITPLKVRRNKLSRLTPTPAVH